MKPIRRMRVVYRNWLFYWLRWMLPRHYHLDVYRFGKWNRVKLSVGCPFELYKCRRVKPAHLIESIVFTLVTARNK